MLSLLFSVEKGALVLNIRLDVIRRMCIDSSDLGSCSVLQALRFKIHFSTQEFFCVQAHIKGRPHFRKSMKTDSCFRITGTKILGYHGCSCVARATKPVGVSCSNILYMNYYSLRSSTNKTLLPTQNLVHIANYFLTFVLSTIYLLYCSFKP